MPFLQRRYVPSILALISGIILYFAVPRWSVETCAWLWLYPLLAVLWMVEPPTATGEVLKGRFRRWWHRATPWRIPFFTGWISGLGFFIPCVRWVRNSPRVISGAVDSSWAGLGAELGGLGTWAAMAGFMALYFGVWAIFAVKVARPSKVVLLKGSWLEVSLESLRSALLAAAFWVVMEWARGIIITGFAWNGLGVALLHNLVLVQIADVVGIAGASFLPVFVSCVVFNTVYRLSLNWQAKKRFRLCFDTSVAAMVLAMTAFYGIQKMRAKPETIPVKVACVQINESQARYWSANEEHIVEMYRRYADLTRLYAENRTGGKESPVDLVIWPEGAVYLPFEHELHPDYFNTLLKMGDFSIFAGCSYRAPGGKPSYNSSVLVRGEWKNAQLYHKIHLVPFGEYLPFRSLLGPILGGVIEGDFDFGPSTEPLKLGKPDVQMIPLICFEDTVSDLVRQFVRDAPQFMANVTNDAWFLDSDEMEQQKAAAVFRCIELRRPMVRATNTGVTCYIDEKGVEQGRLADPVTGSTLIEGVLPGTINVPMHPEMTFYAKHGDAFSHACLALCALAAGLAWRRGRRTAPTR